MLGLLLGIGLSLAIGSGYFEQWRAMPALPTSAREFVAVGRQGIDHRFGISIKTEENAVFGCTHELNNCWIQDQTPSSYEISLIKVVRPCSYNSPEFFLLANPPSQVADCIQATLAEAEWGIKAAFVLDNQGHVWQWYYSNDGLSFLQKFLILSLFGLIIGIVFGSLWAKQIRSIQTVAEGN
jgi:hypothetical protein